MYSQQWESRSPFLCPDTVTQVSQGSEGAHQPRWVSSSVWGPILDSQSSSHACPALACYFSFLSLFTHFLFLKTQILDPFETKLRDLLICKITVAAVPYNTIRGAFPCDPYLLSTESAITAPLEPHSCLWCALSYSQCFLSSRGLIISIFYFIFKTPAFWIDTSSSSLNFLLANIQAVVNKSIVILILKLVSVWIWYKI